MKKLNKLEIISAILVLAIVLTFFYTIFKEKATEEDINYCTEEQKQAEVCIEIYQPVCGYPEEETYSNSCFACMEENVEYWIDDEC